MGWTYRREATHDEYSTDGEYTKAIHDVSHFWSFLQVQLASSDLQDEIEAEYSWFCGKTDRNLHVNGCAQRNGKDHIGIRHG